MNDELPTGELPADQPAPPTAESFALVTEVLERIADDRGLLSQLAGEQMHRLLRAAECVAMPTRSARKQLLRASRKRAQAESEKKKAEDQRLLAETGIRQPIGTRQRKKACAPRPFDPLPTPQAEHNEAHFGPQLNTPRTCYICKEDFDRLHFFYDSMCANCSELNWTRRNQAADLSGRYALVTGGRVKIGYQAALKLLRAGCHVGGDHAVSARRRVKRFTAEEDSAQWRDRLQVHGIDLRHTPSVEAFADHLVATLPRLDFVLNNACQTVRRPPGFYEHLMEAERQLLDALPSAARPLLASYEELRSKGAVEQQQPNWRPLPARGRRQPGRHPPRSRALADPAGGRRPSRRREVFPRAASTMTISSRSTCELPIAGGWAWPMCRRSSCWRCNWSMRSLPLFSMRGSSL